MDWDFLTSRGDTGGRQFLEASSDLGLLSQKKRQNYLI